MNLRRDVHGHRLGTSIAERLVHLVEAFTFIMRPYCERRRAISGT
jgi:hypothetical protein